jgi:hypothetical protein
VVFSAFFCGRFGFVPQVSPVLRSCPRSYAAARIPKQLDGRVLAGHGSGAGKAFRHGYRIEFETPFPPWLRFVGIDLQASIVSKDPAFPDETGLQHDIHFAASCVE